MRKNGDRTPQDMISNALCDISHLGATNTNSSRDDLSLAPHTRERQHAFWRRYHSCISLFPHLKDSVQHKKRIRDNGDQENIDPWDEELDFFESLDESSWQLLDETSNSSIKASSKLSLDPETSKSSEDQTNFGFQKANGKRVARPSAAAMEQAAKRLRLDDWDDDPPTSTNIPTSSPDYAAKSETSIPTSGGLFVPKGTPVLSTPPRAGSSSRLRPATVAGSASVPSSASLSKRRFQSPLRLLTPQSKVISVGIHPRSYRHGLNANNKRASFTPPFKKGIVSPAAVQRSGWSSGKATQSGTVEPQLFDLQPRTSRITYRDAGIVPRRQAMSTFSSADSKSGLPCEVRLILRDPPLAGQYAFSAKQSLGILGTSEALNMLQELGATRATLKWVQHHWSLILWKLAAYTYWTASDQPSQLWTWESCMRQLRYRYEREFHAKQSSAIKCIQEQLAPASRSMILCVHRILTYKDVEEDGASLVLELTDGWYLIRAEIDAPMRRAVRRGALRVGQKVGIIGAKVC